MIGKTLGKYQILEEIGRGGMATVYKAVDTTTRQIVALKVLPPYFQHEPALLRRFQREAEAAARLRHPHIVPIYEAGQVQGINYIAMGGECPLAGKTRWLSCMPRCTILHHSRRL